MCFYQVVIEDVDSDDDDDDDDNGVMVDNVADKIADDTDGVIVHKIIKEVADELLAYVFDIHNPPPLLTVLTQVGTIQHKDDLPRWIRQMMKKISHSGIDYTLNLMFRIHSLNKDLQVHG